MKVGIKKPDSLGYARVTTAWS